MAQTGVQGQCPPPAGVCPTSEGLHDRESATAVNYLLAGGPGGRCRKESRKRIQPGEESPNSAGQCAG